MCTQHDCRSRILEICVNKINFMNVIHIIHNPDFFTAGTLLLPSYNN